MASLLLPAIWLIVLIAGLPQLSETVYAPSLPEMARALATSESMTEYTLTIYLLGFALGTLFWGKMSDQWGRKPCVIAGLLIFTVGCMGCFLAPSIEMLMISRFIQAFGGSIGSVLGQAICRDAFHGPTLGKMYATIGMSLSIFPAIGPAMGGIIAELFGWRTIFLFLMGCAIILTVLVCTKLPETHPKHARHRPSMIAVGRSMLLDRKVLGLGMIVAGCNGIIFSYFAEGSFYCIKGLGLSPRYYGYSFIAIAASGLAGGLLSRKMQDNHSPQNILKRGLWIIAACAGAFSLMAVVHHFFMPHLGVNIMVAITILSQMGIMLGLCMTTTNALALALSDYTHAIGTASSLFGFFNYSLISGVTFLMGLLHNGTLLPMPLYFLGLSMVMLAIHRLLLRHDCVQK